MGARQIQRAIARELAAAGKDSPYAADANEPDLRYKGYGVRMPAMRALMREYRPEIKRLDRDEKLALAHALIDSGWGEQKTVALDVLQQIDDYFSPDRFDELDDIFRRLYGWSKIDGFAGSLLQKILWRHPKEVVALARRWSTDDDLWLRRASVVVYTRKVAESGEFNDPAIENCERLKFDAEDMVRKGVGWCLKDLMRSDRERLIEYVISLREQGVSSVVTLYAIRDLKGKTRERVLGAAS